MERNVTIKTWNWKIPMYGNKHYCPYGGLIVKGTLNDGTEVNGCFMTKGDKYTDHSPQYIIINKQRYIVKNKGTIYHPELEIKKWEKTKIGRRWMYVN